MLTILIACVATGLILGFLANVMVFRRGEDRPLDMLLGIGGAVAGGLVYRMLGSTDASVIGMWTVLPAAIGAGAALILWRAIKGSLRRA